jgi:hypothetical protein
MLGVAPNGRGKINIVCCKIFILLVLDQPVDVVLGAVLGGRHLVHIGDAQQGLPGVSVRNNLKVVCQIK